MLSGIRAHVIHQRADPGHVCVPVLLAHGWPDSAWRYRNVLPLLAAGGDDAYDVVVPDMPGFGFSDRPAGAPLDSRAVARMWAELMTALGYQRFVVTGGGIGSHVARYLALDHPDLVVAVHRMDAGLPVFSGNPADLTDAERQWLPACAQWGADEGGYAAMHRTKPQTAAVGLADSPAGLAAWITEKLRSWSDCDGDLWSVYTRDDVLALLTEYWVTNTIGSSMRMYRANSAIPREQLMRRVEVPSGFSIFPGDILPPAPGVDGPSRDRCGRFEVRVGTSRPIRRPEVTRMWPNPQKPTHVVCGNAAGGRV